MTICFLTHNLKQDNGTGILSLRIIKGVEKLLGVKVIALTTQGSGFSWERPILYPKKWKLISSFFRIRKILKNCDIIHAIDAYPYGVLAVFCALGFKKKIIITAVGSGSIILLYRWYTSWLLRYCYHSAHLVIAISEFTKKKIIQKITGLTVYVINPGVDFEEFIRASEKPLSREIKQHQPYILSVGALRWRKGYKLSLQAFANVNSKFPGLRYLIIGKKYTEKYLRQLQKIIKNLELEGKVIIIESLASRDLLCQFYRGAELFCLMSQNLKHDIEGFGLVFLEAAASKLPVVGTKDSGIEDAVRDGKNGFLVSSRNPQAFADAIIKILGDPQLKKRMSEHSLVLAKESQWDKRMYEYVLLYRDLF